MITVDEWLSELERLSTRAETAAPDGFRTTQQIAAATGKSLSAIRGWLRSAAGAGRLETATVTMDALDGKRMPVKAYRIKSLPLPRKCRRSVTKPRQVF